MAMRDAYAGPDREGSFLIGGRSLLAESSATSPSPRSSLASLGERVASSALSAAKYGACQP
jgi:hypothetical protein